MFSLVGWNGAADKSAALTEVPALIDQHVTTAGNDVVVPEFAPNIAAVFSSDAAEVLAQLTAPSLRAKSQLDIIPLNGTAIEPLTPTPLMNLLPNGIPLEPGEGLRALIQNGGATQSVTLAWLYDKIDPIPTGPIECIRCTAAITAVVNTWTLGALVFSQQLKAGKYAIVGARASGTTMVAFRLICAGQTHRPGALGADTVSDTENELQVPGPLGLWGTFDSRYPPQLEIFCTAADAAEICYLKLIKIA